MAKISKQDSDKTETRQCYLTKYQRQWETKQQRHINEIVILIVTGQLRKRQQQTTVQQQNTGSDDTTAPVVTENQRNRNETPSKQATILVTRKVPVKDTMHYRKRLNDTDPPLIAEGLVPTLCQPHTNQHIDSHVSWVKIKYPPNKVHPSQPLSEIFLSFCIFDLVFCLLLVYTCDCWESSSTDLRL